jgi:hypothetical protein
MVVLGRLDPVLLRPEVVAAHVVGGSGVILVFLIEIAGVAVMFHAHWVMPAGPAIVAHVSDGVPSWFASTTTAVSAISSTAISSADVSSAAVVLLVCQQFWRKCDGVSE